MHEFQSGQLVQFRYKTGRYIGEFMEVSANSPRAVIKVLAVLEHPDQGDLHHPYRTDVPIFHERRASAKHERVLVPLRDIEPYTGDVPEYRTSLLDAVRRKKEELAARRDDWSARGLELLERLEAEYERPLY